MYPAGDLDQLERFRREEQPLEQLHLRLRTELAKTRPALHLDPGNQELAGRVRELEERLADLERRAPWIAGDLPVEIGPSGAPAPEYCEN